MYYPKAPFAVRSILLTVVCALHLVGCGDGEYQSDEEFVKSLGNTGEAVGTMPPIGESMDQVAKIRFETTDLDLGTVRNDAIHHHKLKVFNDGKMPLKITKIDTTCACTMGYFTPETALIPPGGESWIDVTLEPNRVPGFESHKVLTITSTDPEQAQVEVQVRAKIEPEFYVDTADLDFGDIHKGEVVERRIRLRQIQEAPVTVSGIEVLTLGPLAPKIPGISPRVEDIAEDQWQTPGKREYDIIIATGPELSAGAFKRSLVLLTDVARLEKFHIGVIGTALAPYAPTPVYPERITLQPTPDHSAFVARANFISSGPLSLAVGEISSPLLAATVVPGSTPNEVAVEVSVPAASMPRKLVDETVSIQVTAEGKTFTEIVGVRNAGNAEASGHEGHDH